MELELEMRALNSYTQNYKQMKELLFKQKNEVEMKYNSSLIQIAQLNQEKVNLLSHEESMKKEMEKNKEKYELFKQQIVKEYKGIQNDFSLVKIERDLLKGTLLDFKNYFIKFIGNDGELIS